MRVACSVLQRHVHLNWICNKNVLDTCDMCHLVSEAATCRIFYLTLNIWTCCEVGQLKCEIRNHTELEKSFHPHWSNRDRYRSNLFLSELMTSGPFLKVDIKHLQNQSIRLWDKRMIAHNIYYFSSKLHCIDYVCACDRTVPLCCVGN